MKFGFGTYKDVEIDEIFSWTKEHKQRNKEITKLLNKLEEIPHLTVFLNEVAISFNSSLLCFKLTLVFKTAFEKELNAVAPAFPPNDNAACNPETPCQVLLISFRTLLKSN